MKRDYVINNTKLMEEWDWEKNNELGFFPNKLTLGSGKSVYWMCKQCGHRYPARIANRSCLNRGCPECGKRKQKSSQEIKLFYYIKQYFPDAISGYQDIQNGITEIDIYIPNLYVGIEYDGGKWHEDVEKDKNKDAVCRKNGIKLIRIREPKCPQYDSDCMFIALNDRKEKTLVSAFIEVFRILGINDIKIDFGKDFSNIESLFSQIKIDNSLAKLYPDVAAEWHPTKNGALTPDMVSPCSDKNVWWFCKIHRCSYMARVADKITYGVNGGCHECKSEKISKDKSVSVYCPQLDAIFCSQTDAGRKIGINRRHICECCLGQRDYAGVHPVTGEPLTWKKVI